MTLMELMVALAIGGLLLVSGRALLAQLQDAGATLGRSTRTYDERATALRTLRALARRADVRPDSTSRFVGDSLAARFPSSCERPGGWLARCTVEVQVDEGRDGTALAATISTGSALRLERRPGVGRLRYLDVAGAEDQWMSQWGNSIVAPAAMALVVGVDTLVLPLAGR